MEEEDEVARLTRELEKANREKDELLKKFERNQKRSAAKAAKTAEQKKRDAAFEELEESWNEYRTVGDLRWALYNPEDPSIRDLKRGKKKSIVLSEDKQKENEQLNELAKTWDRYVEEMKQRYPTMEKYNQKITELQKAKLQAQEKGDEKRANILQRRIRRYEDVVLSNIEKYDALDTFIDLLAKARTNTISEEEKEQLELYSQEQFETLFDNNYLEIRANQVNPKDPKWRLAREEAQRRLAAFSKQKEEEEEEEEEPPLQELDLSETLAQKREQQRQDREAGRAAGVVDAWFKIVNGVDVLKSIWGLQNSLPFSSILEISLLQLNFMREYWGRRQRERGEGKLPTYKEVAEAFEYIAGSRDASLVFWKAFFDEAERRMEAMTPYQKAEVFNPKRTEKRGVLILPERKEEKTMMMDKSPRRSRSSSDDEGGQESMAVSPPRSRSPSPKGKEELSEQPTAMSQEEALDSLIDLLAKAASDDVPLSAEEERVLRRIPYETYQVLNDNDIRDRMRQVDPDETSPKWGLVIEEVGRRLAALEPKWAVGKLFDSMDMATRLQAALQEHGYQVSRLREDAALAKLRRFMIRNFEYDTAYLINTGSIGSMDEGLAEAIRLVESPEANLAIWQSFLLDVASRTGAARRPPGRVKVTGPPRSAAPAPVVAVEPMKRVDIQDVWRLTKEFNQSIERWRAIRAMINNYKHQDMSDEALRFEFIFTLWTGRWKEILPLHKYDRATKIRLLLENAVKYLSNEALLLFNRIYRIMSLDNLRKEVAKEEGILDDIARKLASPPYLDFSRDGTTYINWRERFDDDDEDSRERYERLYAETQTLEGIDSAFLQLKFQAADYEKNMIRLENSPFSKEVKEEWEDNFHDLISLQKEMDAILEYRAAFAGTKYVPLERYERIPPWKESELEASIIEADTELRERKEQLDEFDRKAPWSLEKLKKRYTKLSAFEKKFRTGLKSNASEKSLRKLHAEEMAKEREKLVSLVEYWIQRGPELRAELERVRAKKRAALPSQQPQSDDEGGQESMAVSPRRSRSPSSVPKEKEELFESPRRSQSPSPIFWESPRRERSRSRSPSPVPKEKEEESDRDRRNRLKREKRTQDRARQNNAVRQYEDFIEKVFSGPNMLEIRLAKYPAVPYEGTDTPSLDEQVVRVKNWLRYEWFSENEGWPTAKQIAKGASEGEFYQFNKRAFSTPLKETGKKQRINACVACAAPLENTNRYACGAGCKTVLYCGQDCADAHWEEHNCRLVKE